MNMTAFYDAFNLAAAALIEAATGNTGEAHSALAGAWAAAGTAFPGDTVEAASLRVLLKRAGEMIAERERLSEDQSADADEAELDARTAIGMPLKHPERITRDLPDRDEEWLAEAAASLWPDDEYAEVTLEIRNREGQS
jgi:hypothetical protein